MVVSALSTTIAMSSAGPASDVSISKDKDDDETPQQITNGTTYSEITETPLSQSKLETNKSYDEKSTDNLVNNSPTLQPDNLLEPVNSDLTNEPSIVTPCETNADSNSIAVSIRNNSNCSDSVATSEVVGENIDMTVAEDDDCSGSHGVDQSSMFENASIGQVNFKNSLNFDSEVEPMGAVVKEENNLDKSFVPDDSALANSLVKEELIIDDCSVKREVNSEEDEEAKSMSGADEEMLLDSEDQQSNNGMAEDEITIEDETVIESTDEALDDDGPSAAEDSQYLTIIDTNDAISPSPIHDSLLEEKQDTRVVEGQEISNSEKVLENIEDSLVNEKLDICDNEKVPEKIVDIVVNKNGTDLKLKGEVDLDEMQQLGGKESFMNEASCLVEEKSCSSECKNDEDGKDGTDVKSQFATAVKQFMDIGKKPESSKRVGEPIGKSTNCKKPKLDSEASGSSDGKERVCLLDNDEEDVDDPPSPSLSATPVHHISPVEPMEKREPLSSSLKFLRENAISKLTRSELEELMVQKICESICNRSQEGALRRRAEALEKEVFKWQEIGRCCEKQVRELKTVLHKYLAEIEKSKGSRPAAPMKVTRSVGLQVGQCPRVVPPPRAKPTATATANAASQAKLSTPPPSAPAHRSNVRFPPPLKQVSPAPLAPKMLRTLTPVNSAKQSPVTPVGQTKSPRVLSPSKLNLVKATTSTNCADSVIDLTDDDPVPAPSVKTPGSSPKFAYLMPGTGGPKYVISAQAPPPPLVFNGHKHPAPLPALPLSQPSRPSWKNIPPRPLLKISSTKTGIVLSWEMALHADHEEIASYQLYAYQQGTSPPSPLLWREIGDVKALPLPMACTLSCFVPGYRYHFSVRAIDIHSRVGPFSLPGSILLKGGAPK